MSLKDLPVVPTETTDNVKEAYIKERDAIMTPEQLWEFAKRWRPLYLLSRKEKFNKKGKDAKRFRLTQKNMQALISGDWDPKKAWVCVQALKQGECSHLRSFGCVGSHIILPPVFLLAEFISDKYGVTTDLAIIQMGGGLERLES